MLPEGEGTGTAMEEGGKRAVLKKIGKAIMYFIVFAMAVPIGLGLLLGVSVGAILSLIGSAVLLQAGAPPIGLALGLEPVGIIIIMACFALGMVLAVREACESLALSSDRVKAWIDSMEEKTRKYPQIQKYGPISCILIAWIPGIGLYGTPIISWILKWKRITSTVFTVLGFTIASIFVLYFLSNLKVLSALFLLAGTLGVVIFAVASMLSLAFAFTIPELLAALKNYRLMALTLLANLVLVPLAAFLLIRYIPLHEGYRIGLAILATAAGATFLLKLVNTIRGNTAPVGGIMVITTLISVALMPLVLPLMLPGTSLDTLRIAGFLVLLILLPLVLALLARARFTDATTRYAPLTAKASAVALGAVLIGFLGAVVLRFFDGNPVGFLGIIGTGAILVSLVFLGLAFGIGYLLGGPDRGTRLTLALSSGQRNLAAAAVVAFLLFQGNPDVMIMVVVTGLSGLILFMVGGKRLAKTGV
ncbi:MAG: hypothetical protein LUQ64_01885 [Methanomicrobiales archaeon]|nr:hypothetical protein [Methanomicrobiales archaeon]